jgi:hypothetical protein
VQLGARIVSPKDLGVGYSTLFNDLDWPPSSLIETDRDKKLSLLPPKLLTKKYAGV